MKTLNDILREFHAIEDMLIESGGEITDEIQTKLDEHDADFDAKKDRYIGLIRALESSKAGVKQIESQAKSRAKTLDNAVEGLRDRLLWAMQAMGVKSAKHGLYVASIQHKTVYTVNTDLIPDDLTMELSEKGWLRYDKKYDLASIKKEYAGSEFVEAEEKEILNLR